MKTTGHEVSTDFVRARWAYSELLSRAEYSAILPAALKEKAILGWPFADLTPEEWSLLAQAWQGVRGVPMFTAALRGIATFRLAHWSKDELVASYVIPSFVLEVSPDPTTPVTFLDWLKTPPKVRIEDLNHARYAGDSKSDAHPIKPPATASWASRLLPVSAEAYMLLDGYHRAVRFVKRSAPPATFAVYVPAE
jgi:hypothetical protein